MEERHKKIKRKKFVYFNHLDSLARLGKSKQFYFDFMDKFLDKIEFNDNNLAIRFYPLAQSKNIVVDPKYQFGQPIIAGTNIKVQTIYDLYNGGESLDDISVLYNISMDKTRDAVKFQTAA